MPKYTGKQLAIKREIDRINRQIRQAYKKFGSDSRLYKQYESILYLGNTPIAHMRGAKFEGVRINKEGIAQISVSKSAIWEFSHLSYYEKQLKMLGRMQTVESAQKSMLRAFEIREGVKLRTAKDKQQALKYEIDRYNLMEKSFEIALHKVYEIQKQRGVRLKAIEDIKRLSKGRWTSEEDFKKMYEILDNALHEENAEVVQDVFAKNQW